MRSVEQIIQNHTALTAVVNAMKGFNRPVSSIEIASVTGVYPNTLLGQLFQDGVVDKQANKNRRVGNTWRLTGKPLAPPPDRANQFETGYAFSALAIALSIPTKPFPIHGVRVVNHLDERASR